MVVAVDFFDALSQEKRKLNIKTRSKHPTGPVPMAPWCLTTDAYGHDFENYNDDFNRCRRCGCTLIQYRARVNLRKKH